MRRPVNSPYTITTEFGVPDSYAKFGYHSGVDYAVEAGRPIYAPVSGQLQNIVSPTGGNMVVIFANGLWHRLMHNTSFTRQNGWVNEGDQVATAGTTGLSTGVHSHWDINKEGIYPTSFNAFIPPADFLAGKYQTNQGEVMTTNDGIELYRTGLHREAESQAAASQWNGQTPATALYGLRTSPEWQILDSKLKAYDTLQAQVAELSARPTKDELSAVVQTLNDTKNQVAVLETQLAEEKAKPPVKETVEVVKEVTVDTTPEWVKVLVAKLPKSIQDLLSKLKRSK